MCPLARSPVTNSYVGLAEWRIWEAPQADSSGSGSTSTSTSTSALLGRSPPPEGAAAAASARRRRERWVNILVLQSRDSLGSMVLLTDLVRHSAVFGSEAFSGAFLALVRDLIRAMGPQPRFLGLFGALATVGGAPSRPHQEMLVRHLWMNPVDR